MTEQTTKQPTNSGAERERITPIWLVDFEAVAHGIDYLRSIGAGVSADAIEAIVIRDERTRDDWKLCGCGARKPAFAICPVCDKSAICPCICVEFNPWSKQ